MGSDSVSQRDLPEKVNIKMMYTCVSVSGCQWFNLPLSDPNSGNMYMYVLCILLNVKNCKYLECSDVLKSVVKLRSDI